MTILLPPILGKLNTRLKEARLKLGLNQAELAAAGEVTRTAQVRYESGETAPSIDYIRGIQTTNIDLQFILFGAASNKAVEPEIDWKLLQEAAESVEFFCIKVAPNCPNTYKWQLIKRVYTELIISRSSDTVTTSLPTALEVVQDAWEKT